LLVTSATDKFFDDGGNTFVQGTLANSIAAGTLFGSLSATGNALVIGNVVLTSGWGTSTVTSASGDSHRMRFTITVAGTPAAGPVVTVTFPTAYPFIAPASCGIQQVGGTFTLTNPAVGIPTTTTVAITFTGTPVAAQVYTYDLSCGP
jgi:hypothetical protein